MALRPAGLDLMRALCRRDAAHLVRAGLVRPLSSSSVRSGLFSRKSDKAAAEPSSDSSVPNITAQDLANAQTHPIEGQPLTDFQRRIAALETDALESRSSSDPKPQIALLRALAEGGENNGVCKYYDAVALAEPGSAEGSDALLRSNEAFELYCHALAYTGRLSEVAAATRRRDERIGAPATSAADVLKQVTGAAAAGASSTPASGSSAAAYPQNAFSSSTASSSPSTGSSSYPPPPPPPPPPAGTVTGATTGPGSPLQPIYVQLAPNSPQTNTWRVLRYILGMLFWGFVIFTVISMVMENTGLLKAGPGPAEFEPEEGKAVKFADVHGVEEAKQELQEIVEFLKNPEKFSTLGGKLPKGVLLTGPPGTGKTMLARAVAGEAEVPFLFASGSSFDEMFVGVGAKRVRELFAAARKKAPAIVFIDELDAIGSKRSSKDQHYMKQTLNQLLVELDGFEQSEGVIIIAATNFPQSLDKALTRPGRFDRHVVVPLPDVRGRIEILRHHMGNIKVAPDVDAAVIARGTPGMSGADLSNLVNQAAVKAARSNGKAVTRDDFEWAKDRIRMGAERRSHFVTEDAKKATAYHEGGHALVALHTPGADPLHKVTIMPRGSALGITFLLPEMDKDSRNRKEYQAMIDVALGGRAAEELIYGEDGTTSGCSSDLVNATNVATRMVRTFGYSDKVGLVAHEDDQSRFLSDQTKDLIESEIKLFLDDGMARVRHLLKTRENELHTLAAALVEYETLDLDEVKQVLRGEKLDRLGASGIALRTKAEEQEARDKAQDDKAVSADPQSTVVSQGTPREV
ncbi:hypothetical protein CspeluHIS016_0303060 [Cutaneotrichosporon spelunceum]|uniref:AAA+ ATPase domain-containing protein n=1 Tax=Cutaneotrichosporon spelunceum TaxID=1672016 RepID=A0AAD3YAY4_9TREE|nr:hypothetical protein CspeluHIS016_0303060 [Cutaneotrichosporon spelunceum]